MPLGEIPGEVAGTIGIRRHGAEEVTPVHGDARDVHPVRQGNSDHVGNNLDGKGFRQPGHDIEPFAGGGGSIHEPVGRRFYPLLENRHHPGDEGASEGSPDPRVIRRDGPQPGLPGA